MDGGGRVKAESRFVESLSNVRILAEVCKQLERKKNILFAVWPWFLEPMVVMVVMAMRWSGSVRCGIGRCACGGRDVVAGPAVVDVEFGPG